MLSSHGNCRYSATQVWSWCCRTVYKSPACHSPDKQTKEYTLQCEHCQWDQGIYLATHHGFAIFFLFIQRLSNLLLKLPREIVTDVSESLKYELAFKSNSQNHDIVSLLLNRRAQNNQVWFGPFSLGETYNIRTSTTSSPCRAICSHTRQPPPLMYPVWDDGNHGAAPHVRVRVVDAPEPPGAMQVVGLARRRLLAPPASQPKKTIAGINSTNIWTSHKSGWLCRQEWRGPASDKWTANAANSLTKNWTNDKLVFLSNTLPIEPFCTGGSKMFLVQERHILWIFVYFQTKHYCLQSKTEKYPLVEKLLKCISLKQQW